jgi:two-component system, LuxR family, sensor kinase FixL
MSEKTLLQKHLDDETQGHFSLADAQMRVLYHSLPVSLLSSIIIALILSISHWQIIGQGEIILWNLLLGGTLLARLILWIFWHNVHQLYSAFFWLTCFRLGVWCTGAAWGASALFLFAHNEPIYQALLAFSLAGVASGSMTSLTVDKYSSLGFAILAIAPLSVIIYVDQGPTAIAMSGMTLLFIFFVITSASRARQSLEEQLNKNQHLLNLTNKINEKQKLEKIINHAQSIFISEGDIKSALNTLLQETLALSHSELGFIGQVERDRQEKPFMRALVFASNKKDDRTLENFRATNFPENGEYRNLDNLFGKIMLSEKPVISPNLARDMRAGTLPEGHPIINSFIGIPIFSGRDQIAILGLANAAQGYTNQTAVDLESILKSIAQFVQTMNHEQRHANDKAALEASTQHTQTILNDIADGIITINRDGAIQSFNHAAETIFGYRAKQIIGKNISELMPEPHKSLHDGYLKTHLKTGKKNIIGIGRELKGLRRNGSEFPMDLMVSRVFQNGEPIFIGVVRDITEKKRIDDLRSQFISAASKEILGPLNLISEVINLLKADEKDHLPPSFKHAIEIASNNSIKLQKLMGDLIEVENLSQEGIAYTLATYPANKLIEETVHRNKAFSNIYQCPIRIESLTHNLTIHIDKLRFDQALTQLIQYALKLAAPKDSITIRAEEEHSRIKIMIGMPSRANSTGIYNNLLLYFSNQNDKPNENTHAEGELGLAIAKEIIEKMHGKIYFESKAKTHCFVIEFQQAVKQF